MNRLFLLLLCTAMASGQTPKHDRVEFGLLAADAGVRGLDVYSTHRMLDGHNHEKVLPDAISHHVPALIGFEGGMVVFNAVLAHELEKHGHGKLAHWATAFDIGIDAPGAIRNLTLK